MRILVTGASGFVGRHLVASLRGGGNSVTRLVRGADASPEPDRFAGPADLADLDAWPHWPAGIDAVVHLAALNPSRGRPATPAALDHANVVGTAALARRARREGVRRVLFLSTSNVHAPGPTPTSAPIRETDPLLPQSPYARSKAEAETAFWRALAGGDTQGCVLRPAPVYGSGGRGNVAALVRLARLPVPLPVADLGGRRSLVAVDHLVSAIEACLRSDAAAGQTFLVADETPLALGEIVRAVRRGWGRPDHVFALPPLLRMNLDARLSNGGPLGDFVIDSAHLIERTGWRPRAATAESLCDMARRGDL